MSTRTYRGFTIREDFMSANGTGILCHTRQGWIINEFEEVARGSGLFGWASTLTRAKAMVDRAYEQLEAGESLLPARAALLVLNRAYDNRR